MRYGPNFEPSPEYARHPYLIAHNRDGTREVVTPSWQKLTRGQIIDEADLNFRMWDVATIEVVGGPLNGWRIENPRGNGPKQTASPEDV